MSSNEAFKAAYENNVAELKKEVDKGISINCVHPSGKSSLLQAACESDAIQVLQYLLELGADPNQRISKISRIDGRVILNNGVALMYAQSVEAAELLIEYGANIEIKDGDGNSVIEWAKEFENQDLVQYYLEKINS
jgi:ankyrin repeat protein